MRITQKVLYDQCTTLNAGIGINATHELRIKEQVIESGLYGALVVNHIYNYYQIMEVVVGGGTMAVFSGTAKECYVYLCGIADERYRCFKREAISKGNKLHD